MAQKIPRNEALEAEIRRLPDLGLRELRARWNAVFGNPAPKSLRRKFLARAVAYQMQVATFGGLSSSTKRRLAEIAGALRRGDADAAGIARKISPGTQMIRQWRDKTHVVTAMSDGFEWNGQIYRSLSAIAKQITGTNWNGYAFFGIKRAPLGNKNAAGSRSQSGKPTRATAKSPSTPKQRQQNRRHA